MARKMMFNPSYQRAFTEAIERENQIRRDWLREYGALKLKSDAVKWDEDPDTDEVFERESICNRGYLENQASQPWSISSKEERAWPASTAPSTTTIPRVNQPPLVMKPVEREVKQILFQGLSHDGEGRAQYLRRRWQDPPEKKYYFPVCSSMEYGWKYGAGNADVLNCPQHGRLRR